jgi:hypothetical protein
MRDLRHSLAPAWPPFLAKPPGRDSIHRVDERATVTGVTILQGEGALAVEITHSRDSHTGVLRWDQPPSLRRAAGVLLAHLGRSIASLGDLDIPGFYGSEVRLHARHLLDGGDAPGEWLALVRSEPGVGPRVPTTVIAPDPDALCSLCDDYGPRVAYHQPGGHVLRLHAACQAIWLEERDRPR